MLVAGRDALRALGTQGAVQAALGFRQGGLLGQSMFYLGKIRGSLVYRQNLRLGTRYFSLIFRGRQQVFGQRFHRGLETPRHHVITVKIAIDGLRGALAGRDRPDDRGRAGDVVTAGEYAFN